PLSGFLGKLLILSGSKSAVGMVWIWGIILFTSFLAIVGFARGGSTLFWKCHSVEGELEFNREHSKKLGFLSVGFLLAGTVLLALFAGPVTRYLNSTSSQLFNPSNYTESVMDTRIQGGFDG